MPLQNKRITIFGGSEFLGRHVVRRLAQEGALIKVAERYPEKAYFLRPMGEVGQINLCQVALEDPDSIAQTLKDSDAVVNLIQVCENFQFCSVEGARLLAQQAKKAHVRQFIHLSDLAVSDPVSKGAKLQAQGEKSIRRVFPAANLVRSSLIFGTEDLFFNRIAKLATFSPFIPLMGGGKTKFQPVYVGDVAEAILMILSHPQIQGHTFDLGGNVTYTHKQLVVLLLQIIHCRRLLVPISWWIARLATRFAYMPVLPLLDQMPFLEQDSIVLEGHKTFVDLGLYPSALESILPHYLGRSSQGFSKL